MNREVTGEQSTNAKGLNSQGPHSMNGEYPVNTAACQLSVSKLQNIFKPYKIFQKNERPLTLRRVIVNITHLIWI